MDIVKKTELTDSDITMIKELVSYNNMITHKKYNISTEDTLNFSKELNCHHLAFKDRKLVGYANIFAPSKEAFEIQTVVLKDYERIRINTHLLDSVREEAHHFGVDTLLLVCHDQFESGLNYAKKIGAMLDHSEYVMKLVRDEIREESILQHDDIKFEVVNTETLKNYCEVANNIYESTIDNLEEKFAGLITEDKRKFYTLSYDGNQVGIGGISLENDKNFLYGFGILKEYRGKGLSKILLENIIATTQKSNNYGIYLEVDSTNEIAFNLYKKLGFKVVQRIDYFKFD